MYFFFFYISKFTNNCYQKNKEKLRKKACGKYQNLSKEEKEKKRQYGRERFKNFLEDEYRKIFSRMQEIKTIWV